MPTQHEIAEHLDMSERNARDVLKGLTLDWQTASMDEIRTAYIRDLRAKAAGRGGSQLEELNRARIDDLQQKSANGRLVYYEKLRSLIPPERQSALCLTGPVSQTGNTWAALNASFRKSRTCRNSR